MSIYNFGVFKVGSGLMYKSLVIQFYFFGWMLQRSFGLYSSVLLRGAGIQAVSYRNAKTSSVLKQTPEIYYNWIGSAYSMKGVAE